MNEWQPYDPTWLVELARQQRPDLPWLADSLFRCVQCRVESKFYTRFIDGTSANQPGAEWQFRESLFLVDPIEGNLVLDFLNDGRVGGIEYYDRPFSGPKK